MAAEEERNTASKQTNIYFLQQASAAVQIISVISLFLTDGKLGSQSGDDNKIQQHSTEV